MESEAKPENRLIGVLAIADLPVVRAGISSLITAHPKLTLVGSIGDLELMAAMVEQLQPHIILIDWRDPELVLEQLSLLSEAKPLTLILTDEPYSLWRDALREHLIQGIIPRWLSESEILAAIEAVASGLIVMSVDIMTSLLPEKAGFLEAPAYDSVSLQTLTKREIEVLEMLALGLGNKEIAKRLVISEHTVKFHMASLMTKLDASSRTEAVIIGIRSGLILI